MALGTSTPRSSSPSTPRALCRTASERLLSNVAVQNVVGRVRARHEAEHAAVASDTQSESSADHVDVNADHMEDTQTRTLSAAPLSRSELEGRKQDIGNALTWINDQLSEFRRQDVELTAQLSNVLDKMRLSKPTRRRLTKDDISRSSASLGPAGLRLAHPLHRRSISSSSCKQIRPFSGEDEKTVKEESFDGEIAIQHSTPNSPPHASHTPDTASSNADEESPSTTSLSNNVFSPITRESEPAAKAKPETPNPVFTADSRTLSASMPTLLEVAYSTAQTPAQHSRVVQLSTGAATPKKPNIPAMFQWQQAEPRLTSIDSAFKRSNAATHKASIDVAFEKKMEVVNGSDNVAAFETVRSTREQRRERAKSDTDDVFQFVPLSKSDGMSEIAPAAASPVSSPPHGTAKPHSPPAVMVTATSPDRPRTAPSVRGDDSTLDRRSRSPSRLPENPADMFARGQAVRGQRSSLTSSPLLRQKHNRTSLGVADIYSASQNDLSRIQIRARSNTAVAMTTREREDMVFSPKTATGMRQRWGIVASASESDEEIDEIVCGVFAERKLTQNVRHSMSQSLYMLRPISPRPFPPPRTTSLKSSTDRQSPTEPQMSTAPRLVPDRQGAPGVPIRRQSSSDALLSKAPPASKRNSLDVPLSRTRSIPENCTGKSKESKIPVPRKHSSVDFQKQPSLHSPTSSPRASKEIVHDTGTLPSQFSRKRNSGLFSSARSPCSTPTPQTTSSGKKNGFMSKITVPLLRRRSSSSLTPTPSKADKKSFRNTMDDSIVAEGSSTTEIIHGELTGVTHV